MWIRHKDRSSSEKRCMPCYLPITIILSATNLHYPSYLNFRPLFSNVQKSMSWPFSNKISIRTVLRLSLYLSLQWVIATTSCRRGTNSSVLKCPKLKLHPIWLENRRIDSYLVLKWCGLVETKNEQNNLLDMLGMSLPVPAAPISRSDLLKSKLTHFQDGGQTKCLQKNYTNKESEFRLWGSWDFISSLFFCLKWKKIRKRISNQV